MRISKVQLRRIIQEEFQCVLQEQEDIALSIDDIRSMSDHFDMISEPSTSGAHRAKAPKQSSMRTPVASSKSLVRPGQAPSPTLGISSRGLGKVTPKPKVTPKVSTPKALKALRLSQLLKGVVGGGIGALAGDAAAPHIWSKVSHIPGVGEEGGLTPEEVSMRAARGGDRAGNWLRDVTGVSPEDLGIAPDQLDQYLANVPGYSHWSDAAEKERRSKGVSSEIERIQSLQEEIDKVLNSSISNTRYYL